MTHTKEGVCGLVSHDRWDKVKRLIQVLVDMEDKEEAGLDRDKMESTGLFLVYVDRKYRDMNPYLKGLHLTVDIWKPFRDNEGYKIQGKQLKLAEMDEKCDR